MERVVEVRALSRGDVDAVMRVQAACPEAAQWSRAEYERACGSDERGWVCGDAGDVVGFIVTRQAADELEILNLAVEAAARRRGAATELLREALAAGRAGGARRAFLEVRESNAAAIAFYQRNGFVVAGRRANYYSAPQEDALVLRREIAGGD